MVLSTRTPIPRQHVISASSPRGLPPTLLSLIPVPSSPSSSFHSLSLSLFFFFLYLPSPTDVSLQASSRAIAPTSPSSSKTSALKTPPLLRATPSLTQAILCLLSPSYPLSIHPFLSSEVVSVPLPLSALQLLRVQLLLLLHPPPPLDPPSIPWLAVISSWYSAALLVLPLRNSFSTLHLHFQNSSSVVVVILVFNALKSLRHSPRLFSMRLLTDLRLSFIFN